MYLTDSEGLRAFCERSRSADVLAVDTEFLREKTFYPRLCLIQLATDDEVAVVDPFTVDDFSPLEDLLVDERVTKVFHACPQDLEVIRHELGCVPRPVFDTQVACEFLGHRPQLGYGALVQAYTGVRLDKAETLSDWSLRPLDERQLGYAEADVSYLPGIWRQMVAELERLGRLSWVEPEMEAVADPARYEHDPRAAYLRLKRSGGLTRRQLAVARELAAWREGRAASADIPRKWVMRDETVVEISKRCPRTAAELGRIRGAQQLKGEDRDAVLAAVATGLAVPAELQPQQRRRPRASAESEGVVDLMYALVRVVAEENGLATQLIATRDDLADFASGAPGCPLRESWRMELAGSRLERLLAGEVGLTVKDGRVEQL